MDCRVLFDYWIAMDPAALFPSLRRDHDLKSAMLAFCVLFLLTGLLGAFASGAAALPTEGALVIHCYGGAGDDAADTDGVASCCTLACPMVAAAHEAPHGNGILGRTFVGQLAEIAPPALIVPPTRRIALDTARGPPSSF